MPPTPPQPHPAQPAQGGPSPATFWEWITVEYPPEGWLYNWQYYFVAINAAAGQAQATGNINIQVPLFAFAFRSRGAESPTGLPVNIAYQIGIAHSSSNDWTQGQWASEIITGDFREQGQTEYAFPWPREVEESTMLTVTVNNSLSGDPIIVHAGVVGLEVRRRHSEMPVAGV